MWESTRRRVIATLFGVFGTASVPGFSLAQKNKLPECHAVRKFGQWEANASDDLGWVSYAGSDFRYWLGNPPNYWMQRIMRVRPQNQTLNVVLKETNGATRSANVEPKVERQDDGSFNVTLHPDVLFPELDNPLKRPGVVTINVSDGATQLMTQSLLTQGFTEAQQFVQDQQARLSAMEKRKQCESYVPCFLTTACCQLLGLTDDCFELRTLRAFRDGPLQRMPEGLKDIARYYLHAPAILAEMRRRGQEHLLLRYYSTHILPCAVCARLGFDRMTLWLYRDLMRRLERNYLGPSKTVESRIGAVAWAIWQRSVSHPRSSNRACRFPAPGFPTDLH